MKFSDNNAYIDLVKNHDKIFTTEDELYSHKWEWNKLFWNKNDIYLEIGTWHGNFFADESSLNVDKNFIWMEIKYKRLYKTAEKTLANWVDSFYLIKSLAQKIASIFWETELSRIYIYFPDPWANKDRQRKHRLLQEDFIQDMHKVLKVWWKIIFKTDHREYFDSSLEIFEKLSLFKVNKLSYDYEKELEEFSTKRMTEFEHIFREKKIKINYVEFEK